jgi:hypothetical protein
MSNTLGGQQLGHLLDLSGIHILDQEAHTGVASIDGILAEKLSPRVSGDKIFNHGEIGARDLNELVNTSNSVNPSAQTQISEQQENQLIVTCIACMLSVQQQ